MNYFLIASFFATSLSLLKWTGTGANLSKSNLSSLGFKLFKLLGTFLNLSIPNLSLLDYKLAKSTFLSSLDKWTPVELFKPVFIA